MIEEAYISPETAKLLKEKGFNEPCTGLNKILFKDNEKPVMEITQQKAMRWLREKYRLHITIDCIDFIEVGHIFSIKIVDMVSFKEFSVEYEYSYENACEEAIKYCLEKLVKNEKSYNKSRHQCS